MRRHLQEFLARYHTVLDHNIIFFFAGQHMRRQGFFIGQDGRSHRIGFVFGRPVFLEQPGYIVCMAFPCARLGFLFQVIP